MIIVSLQHIPPAILHIQPKIHSVNCNTDNLKLACSFDCVKYSNAHSLQWIDAVCSGSGDDAGLTRLVSSEDEVRWSQQLGVRQQSLGTFIAKR